MKVALSLTKAEAEAVLRAELTAGVGVRRSQALLAADLKIRAAIVGALAEIGESRDAR